MYFYPGSDDIKKILFFPFAKISNFPEFSKRWTVVSTQTRCFCTENICTPDNTPIIFFFFFYSKWHAFTEKQSTRYATPALHQTLNNPPTNSANNGRRRRKYLRPTQQDPPSRPRIIHHGNEKYNNTRLTGHYITAAMHKTGHNKRAVWAKDPH